MDREKSAAAQRGTTETNVHPDPEKQTKQGKTQQRFQMIDARWIEGVICNAHEGRQCNEIVIVRVSEEQSDVSERL